MKYDSNLILQEMLNCSWLDKESIYRGGGFYYLSAHYPKMSISQAADIVSDVLIRLLQKEKGA